MTLFPWRIHKIGHSVKTGKITDDYPAASDVLHQEVVGFLKVLYDVISEISPEFGWIVGHDQHQAVDL